MFRYVDQHFYSPETFLEDNRSLADNAEIRERLFEGFRSEIIILADGEPVEEVRSTDLSQLGSSDDDDDESDTPAEGADPVTEARNLRDQAIESILLDTFDSPLYDEVFTDALASTQAQIVRAAELEDVALLRDAGEVNFDMRRLYPAIYQALAADELTAEITQNAVPDDYGIFKVADRETTIDFFWSLIRNGPSWRGVTYAGAILSLIGAVVAAERRPSTAIQFGGGMFGVALVVVVIVYIIRAIVPILAGGGSTAGPVVATYAANIWPLVSTMIRIMVIGAVIAFAGWIARLIWPDDWVYSHVSDERGIRSIQRRRGAREPEAHQPAAATTPVPYPGYAQPYGYPPGWGQPYPGHPYAGQPYPGQPYGAPGYGYPVGPYAQPAAPLPQQYTSPSNPTVPVMPVELDEGEDAGPDADQRGGAEDATAGSARETVRADPDRELPSDAARIVPRVVASTDPEGRVTIPADHSGQPGDEPADDDDDPDRVEDGDGRPGDGGPFEAMIRRQATAAKSSKNAVDRDGLVGEADS